MTLRTAVLPVADCYGEGYVRRLLPPEHRIVAVRPDPARGRTDCLVEGPSLPERDELWPLLTTTSVDGGGVRLSAQWTPDGDSWTIGEWPSTDAYREEMETLNAKG